MNINLQKELTAMSQAHDKAWEDITKSAKRYGDVPESFVALRSDHALSLQKIVDIHGWTGKSLVGEDGANAAFRIARNATSHPSLMKAFLHHIKEAVVTGEMPKVQEVLIEDCILYYEGKPQNCGIYFEWHTNGELIVNVTSVDHANALRRELGLDSLETALQAHKSELLKERGGVPSDIKEHKQRDKAWAKSVGWI